MSDITSDIVCDVLIIGGGPAGSTAATVLSRAGINTVVLEKEVFPRDHVGESLLPFCYHLFEELNILEEIKEQFSRKPGVQFSKSDNSASTIWCFSHVIDDPSYLSFHVQRNKFDKLLLDHSSKNGARVFENTAVKKVISIEHNKWAVETNSQKFPKFIANFIIDASGQSAFFANSRKTKVFYPGMERTAFACHWSNPNYDEVLTEGLIRIIHLEGEKKGWIWMIPLELNRLSVGLTLESNYVKSKREEIITRGINDWISSLYHSELQESKLVNSVLKEAQTIQPVVTLSDFSYKSTIQYGDNYALIGDAVAFLDPIFSSGIYVAMKSAFLVSEQLIKNIEQKQQLNYQFDKVYSNINQAYELIEKFVRLFYDPEKLDLPTLNIGSPEYNSHERAFGLIHYLLAGDFFTNAKKYIEFIDLLDNPKMYFKMKSYIIDKHNSNFGCGHSLEKIFPELKSTM